MVLIIKNLNNIINNINIIIIKLTFIFTIIFKIEKRIKIVNNIINIILKDKYLYFPILETFLFKLIFKY